MIRILITTIFDINSLGRHEYVEQAFISPICPTIPNNWETHVHYKYFKNILHTYNTVVI